MPKISKVKITKLSIHPADYNRFEIQFPFDRAIVQICREIPGRQFMSNKRWSFPIQHYPTAIKKFKKLPKIEILNELNQKQLADVQLVLLDEDSFNFNVSFPKNDELYKITKACDGFWKDVKFCWSIPLKKKDEFVKKLDSLNYIVKKYEKPKNGKYF